MEFRRLDKPHFVYDHCCLSVLLFLLAPLILISSTRSISYQLSLMGKQPPVYYSLCTANCSLFTVYCSMNIRLIIFSGVMTGLVGAVIGLAAAQIGQRGFNQLKFQGQYYQDLHNKYTLIGGSLGLAVGVAQECVRELKADREDK